MSSEVAVEMYGGRWKRYPAYKDSGVEWLGEVPEGWEIKKLGNQAKMIVPMRDKPPSFNGDIPWIRIEDFDGKYISDSKSNQRVSKETANAMNLKVYPIGTVLCSCSCNMGATSIVENPLISNQTFIGIVPMENIDSEYLYYLMNSNSERLQYLGSGAIQQYLSKENFQNLKFAIPFHSEQRAIAAFLDRETGRIDTLIEKKERQIELLQEKRAALISHAVTKGLDPDVKMKDSGVEWLGEVPGGWKVAKLGFKATVKARLGWKALKAEEYVDEGFIFLATPNIKNKDIDFDNVNYITAERYYESPEIMLQEADVLIVKDGSTLGITNVIKSLPSPTTVNSSIAVIRSNEELHSIFLYYLLSSIHTQNVIQKMKDGQGVPHLFQADIRKFWIWLPSLEEQRAIVTFLDRETVRIDTLSTKVRESISKLREYRTALISAAVTGKIDVRQEAE